MVRNRPERHPPNTHRKRRFRSTSPPPGFIDLRPTPPKFRGTLVKCPPVRQEWASAIDADNRRCSDNAPEDRIEQVVAGPIFHANPQMSIAICANAGLHARDFNSPSSRKNSRRTRLRASLPESARSRPARLPHARLAPRRPAEGSAMRKTLSRLSQTSLRCCWGVKYRSTRLAEGSVSRAGKVLLLEN